MPPERWPSAAGKESKLELLETVEGYLKDLVHNLDGGDFLEKLVDDLQKGKTTPRRAAREILSRLKTEENISNVD